MTTASLAVPRVPRVSGHVAGTGLVLAGLFAQEFGAALAAGLFPRAGASGVATLRLVVAAVLLWAVCRPRVRGRSRADWAVVGAFGATLACMNITFYQAIDRIPLGAAAALEVLGPLALSVITARRASSWLWAALALGGVALLGRDGFDRLDPVGVGFALAAGALWACYIVLAARAGSRFPKADGLALAMAVGAVLSLPIGLVDAGTRLLDPVTLGLGAAVGILSSALPYTLELLALRRITPATFAVLASLLPALAAAAGFLVLDQRLAPLDLTAIALVITAATGAVRTAPRAAPLTQDSPATDTPVVHNGPTIHRSPESTPHPISSPH
ncbi:EamA family transporter [Actinokineospora cianjurensis]|uniref:Inner membrane transporter RhtA n=1 Tax=Actinokineospora cianjurensis TaxID=585224 RepID=A0A421AVG3_9PSEU|nr:EamA family transporter [Actinokineospora cianjurensis]RLK54069.1 inner membrane transporter RhtA [Actinokineospora cianjurensis]